MGPHTYVGLFWPLANSYNFDVDLKVTIAPQTNTGLFWAHQFTFVNESGGYVGLQIVGLKHKAIFSIWGAVGGNPNKNGDTSPPETFNGCRTVEEGGLVWQCLIDYNWQLGTNYRLRLWATEKDSAGNQWWVAAVNDYAAGKETVIGSILAPKSFGWLGSWSTTWIEYFAYQTCDAPHTRAVFSYPYARNYGGDHAPQKALANYGNSGCLDTNIAYLGDGAYVIEAGNGVQRVTTDQTSLWTQEPTLVRQAVRSNTPSVNQAGLSVSAFPNPVQIAGGQQQQVTYRLSETNGVGVTITSEPWVFIYPDGSKGSAGTDTDRIRVNSLSSTDWTRWPLLPTEVAQHAASNGWSSVVLRYTFLGSDDSGNAATADYDLTVTIAPANKAPGMCTTYPFLCSTQTIVPAAGLVVIAVAAVFALQRVKRKKVRSVASTISSKSQTKFCVSCRAELPLDAKFCDDCGASQG
jgi:ribosomal protein L40E